MSKIKTLLVVFDSELRRVEIPSFRGAVIAALPVADKLFHNHQDGGYRYAYPLIQYKRVGGKAAILGVGQGVEIIGTFLAQGGSELHVGSRRVEANVAGTRALMTEVRCWDSLFAYRLRDWLPLNEENFRRYESEERLSERIRILEQTLTGNMLSLLKGVGIHIDEQIKVELTAVLSVRTVHYKRVPLKCFDVEFRANLSLPEYMGLGKHASVGYGILTRKRTEKQE